MLTFKSETGKKKWKAFIYLKKKKKKFAETDTSTQKK